MSDPAEQPKLLKFGWANRAEFEEYLNWRIQRHGFTKHIVSLAEVEQVEE